MRINHNISALKINNILNKNNSTLDKALERLSSGYRINRAADDAAGLAISEKMKTQIAGLNQASRNASDGISVIQTAEGALIEVEQMLQRMRELAVEASNGSYTDSDRATLQDEVNQLKNEITRISETTEFNTKTLLDGTVDRRSYSDNAAVKVISVTDSVAVKSYSFDVLKEGSPAIARTTLVSNTAPEDGVITINNNEIKITAGDSISEIVTKLTSVCDSMGIYVGLTDGVESASGKGGYASVSAQNAVPGTTSLLFVTDDYGTDAKLSISCSNANLASALGLGSGNIETKGTDAEVTLGVGSAKGATCKTTGIPAGTDVTTGEIIYTIHNDTSGLDEIVKFEVGTNSVKLAYTNASGNTQIISEPINSLKGSDVVNAMKTLVDRMPSGTAIEMSVSGTDYLSIDVTTNATGKNISIDMTDMGVGLVRNTSSRIDRAASMNGTNAVSQGTMSATFSDEDGNTVSLTFEIGSREIKMIYSENGVVIRSQSGANPPADLSKGYTASEAYSVIEALQRTLPDRKITYNGDFEVNDAKYTIASAEDTTGYICKTTGNPLRIPLSEGMNYDNLGGSLFITLTDGTGHSNTRLFGPSGAVSSISDLVNDIKGQTTPEFDSYSIMGQILNISSNNSGIYISSNIPGITVGVATTGKIEGPFTGIDVDPNEDFGTGYIDINYADGSTINITVDDDLLKVTRRKADGTIKTRTQVLSDDRSTKTMLEDIKELISNDMDHYMNLSESEKGITFSLEAATLGPKISSCNTNLAILDQTYTTEVSEPKITPGRSTTTSRGTDVGGFTNTATVTTNGDYITVRDRDGFEMVLQAAGGSIGKQTSVTVLDAGPMTLQIGANEGQTMEVRIPCVDTTTLFIDTADVSTQDGAQAAITLFDNAINEVSAIRAKLGAYENRLDHAINSLDTSAENLTEALSRIADTDMAKEMASYTQLQVLVQAATSMLSQANERPQQILNLLQS